MAVVVVVVVVEKCLACFDTVGWLRVTKNMWLLKIKLWKVHYNTRPFKQKLISHVINATMLHNHLISFNNCLPPNYVCIKCFGYDKQN